MATGAAEAVSMDGETDRIERAKRIARL